MSFDTPTFWLFFAVAWTTWRLLPFTAAKGVALLLSLVFYGWWNPWYLPLMLASAGIDYVASLRIAAAPSQRARRAWLAAALCANLGLLAFFKYAPFAVENARILCRVLGIEGPAPLVGWVIPVGISFYTFQSMSYSIDVYRGVIRPIRHPRDFFLFVTFFPQLVAGPIIRAKDFLPQLEGRRRLAPLSVQTGMYEIVVGLFLKVVVADNLAPAVEKAFDPAALPELSPVRVWLGVIYFGAQIFADFAGYSAIAIGLARTMGLRFMENFRAPYIAQSLSEFWRRWHISLSTWLRDYLYVSLGGSRRGTLLTYRNLLVTMLLGGLWHGAAWTFVVWGALHGAGLCIERALARGPLAAGAAGLPLALVRMLLVFVFVHVAWVFFRAQDLPTALAMLERMFVDPFRGPLGIADLAEARHAVFLVPIALLHGARLLEERYGLRSAPAMRAVVAALLLVLLTVVARPETQSFIYFQF